MLKAYNGGKLSGNSPRATALEIKLLELDANSKDNVKKARTLVRVKYLATSFLLSSDRRRYGYLILDFKKHYANQQRNYLNTLTDMYSLMVAFETTRLAVATRGHNEGLNFGNVATYTRAGGARDVDRGGNGSGIKIESWNCGGNHLKRNFPKLDEDRKKRKIRRVVHTPRRREVH